MRRKSLCIALTVAMLMSSLTACNGGNTAKLDKSAAKALEYAEDKDYEEAAEEIKKILEQDPDYDGDDFKSANKKLKKHDEAIMDELLSAVKVCLCDEYIVKDLSGENVYILLSSEGISCKNSTVLKEIKAILGSDLAFYSTNYSSKTYVVTMTYEAYNGYRCSGEVVKNSNLDEYLGNDVGDVAAATTTAEYVEPTTAYVEPTTAYVEPTTAYEEPTTANVDYSNTGKVLNIYCWNDEFSNRMSVMPGYTMADEKNATKGGKIGDVTVNFVIVTNSDNKYQDNLDRTLWGQDSAAADDKIDMFLVEADYALKYVDTDYTLPMEAIGVTADDVKNQYAYTQDVMRDSNGVLKGVSWQACPGLMFYNRDIAKEVLGTDDPDKVQEYVSDWSKYEETAAKMEAAGYLMQPSTMDSYRVYSNNVSKAWVDSNKNIQIDDNIKAWVDKTMDAYKNGYTKNVDLWDGYANATNGGCFAAFGPAWLINYCFGYDAYAVAAGTADMTNVANAGKWGACNGPQGFYWGGTWICAAKGTDNANLIADIMKALTCNTENMKKIVEKYDDFVNDQPAMEEMAKSSYSSYILGGQNPLGLYAEGAKRINLNNLTSYDQGCNEEFQYAMINYFDGKSTYDEALKAFYTAIKTRYPNVNVPK